VEVDISTEHLVKIDAYLRKAVEQKMTPHHFPLSPYDFDADPRIVPKFSTSFVFPDAVQAKPFNMTTDPEFTLECATRKFMSKDRSKYPPYTPFEIDLVATSDLDSAQRFFMAASYLGIPHLEKLATIPLCVWAFYFPARPDVIQSYFDIKSDLTEEKQKEVLAKINEMLEKVYGKMDEKTDEKTDEMD